MIMSKYLGVSGNLFEHFDVVETVGDVRNEDIRRVIAKVLDRSRSLPESWFNDNSAPGGSSGTKGDAENHCAAGASSMGRRTVPWAGAVFSIT